MNGLIKSKIDLSTVDGIKEALQMFNDLSLFKLPEETQRALFASAKKRELEDQIIDAAKIAKIDWKADKELFLKSCESAQTRRAYEQGLSRLEAWAYETGRELAGLRYRDAAEFLEWLKNQTIKRGKRRGEGLSGATIRATLSACGAFYSELERLNDGAVSNPFLRIKKRPTKTPVRPCAYPSRVEIGIILEACKRRDAERAKRKATNHKLEANRELADVLYEICLLIFEQGFRAGSFADMQVSKDGTVSFTSKGKRYSGIALTEKSLQALHGRTGYVFRGWSPTHINDEIKAVCKELFDRGSIAAVYSPHDGRHAYAAELYRRSGHDIYKVSRALGHTSIAVTGLYLRETLGLKVEADPQQGVNVNS